MLAASFRLVLAASDAPSQAPPPPERKVHDGIATRRAIVPVVGDQHWSRVTWKGGDDLGVPTRRDVTLRVGMKQAKLYGLEME